MKSIVGLLSLLGATSIAEPLDTLLDLNFSRPEASWAFVGTGEKPVEFRFLDSQKVATNGALNFNASGALIKNFSQPKGAYYIETVFRFDRFGDEESFNISDIVTSATWPNMDGDWPIQGFGLRIGGGKFYPQLPRDQATDDAAYHRSLSVFDQTQNQKQSRCLLEFVQASTGGRVWKETYADRCIEKGVWHHVVASWDGEEQRLFINGVDAVDGGRTLGADLAPRVDAVADLYFGTRTNSYRDFRYFYGDIRYIKIVNGSVGLAKARALYRNANLTTSTCKSIPEVVRPRTLEALIGSDSIHVGLVRGPGCADQVLSDSTWGDADSLDVLALANDSSSRVLGQVRVAKLSFPVSHLNIKESGVVGFKLKVRRAPKKVAARTAASEEWYGGRPFVLLSQALGVKPKMNLATNFKRVSAYSFFSPSEIAKAVRLDGQVRALKGAPVDGGFMIDVSGLTKGVWVLKQGVQSETVFVP